MGKFDFEIQPAPEPPDPEAARAPLERTALQISVTWLTLIPVVAAALVVFACGLKHSVAASAAITRSGEVALRAPASLAAHAPELAHWGHHAETIEQVWRATYAARLEALYRHRQAGRLLMLLAAAACVPALIIWGRGQFGRPEGARRIDLAQVALCSLALTVLAAGWWYDTRTLALVQFLGPAQDPAHLATATIEGAKAERLTPWRQALYDAIETLHPPVAADANAWCAADTVHHCLAQPEFNLLEENERASLRRALESLTRAHYNDVAFEPLARARRPFLGDDGVEALLAEQARETRQFADDAEAAQYLFDAIRRDNDAEVRMMIRRGFDLNAPRPGPDGGYTPLFAAVHHRRRALARLLVDAGARPDIGSDPRRGPDRSGDFPVHAAVGDVRLMKLLLDRGADPDVRNAAGRTPLHVAALAGDRSSIKLLATRRADLNAPDACGQTPLDLTNDPHATDAARGANALLQQLGALTAVDLEHAAALMPPPVATTPPQE